MLAHEFAMEDSVVDQNSLVPVTSKREPHWVKQASRLTE